MESPAPTLAAIVREQTGLSWSRARALCAEGRVTVDGERRTDPAARVAPGAVVVVNREAPRAAKGPLAKESIVYHDRDIVVVVKPAGMLTVADQRGNKDTLVEHTRTLLRRAAGRSSDTGLDVVHRLDRDTSGLVVLTRTAEAKRALAAQFRAHDVDRIYHAIAHGTVAGADIDTLLLPDRGDGLRGSFGAYRRAAGTPPPDAKRAITHVKALQALRGATLVECRLETGRQHQIRIHLSERGHPLVGEAVYVRDFTGPRIAAPRAMLHARTLGFIHPRDGRRLDFESEPPADFMATLLALHL